MTSVMHTAANWSLKEDIRTYWSKRAETFDQSFGHRILKGPEHDAWAEEIRSHFGDKPLDVLELASGTGEVTGVLLSLGHRVTGIDFSEAMIERSRAKHKDNPRARFILSDAENTRELDGSYDAVVCRHLVWTLTDPEAALQDWYRVLRPGGRVLIFDGDFVNLPWRGRLAKKAMNLLERFSGPDLHRDPSLAQQHTAILQQLPFRNGLTFENLKTIAEQAGFTDITRGSYRRIHRAQRSIAGPHDWLRTWLHDRFILCARKF
ncbi:class I SAM-dependent methyltransferase [Microvirga rosea]|uniref:class I SAM-dependent methyltransferase n=1 Tax=Microvirga rosea TaxID=2715425 RepID=UPI001D0BB714|nr:class I SAM-dependent methyltransferase [Microvirga rosea]MCB8821405.1 class I SAM-dependent methyltransferase [Microvirga rosea]